MLLTPYLTGMAVFQGAFSLRSYAALAGVVLMFFSRPPLMLLLKRKFIDGGFGSHSRALWLNFIIPAAAGAGIFSWLAVGYRLWQLPLLAVAGLLLFLVHTGQALRRKERSALGEFTGIVMLTMTAPLAVYVGGEQLLSRDSFMLWLLNALYFGASVYFIKMFMRAAAWRGSRLSMGDRFALGKNSLAYLAIMALVVSLLTATSWVPPYTFVAFVPIFVHVVRNVITLRPGANLKVEGFIQAGLSLAYAVLLVVSYRI